MNVFWVVRGAAYEARFDVRGSTFARIDKIEFGWELSWIYGPRDWTPVQANTVLQLERIAEKYIRFHESHIKSQMPATVNAFALSYDQADIDDAFWPGFSAQSHPDRY